MPQRIIGIDIGSYSVKMAVVERSFKSFSFVEFYERRIQYNELLSPDESKAIAIQGLIDDCNLTWDGACAGFPAQKVTSRLITFPFGSRKKIAQTVEFEIESYIPFGIASVVLDYDIVWQTKDASKVLVIYVQKGDVAKELSMLVGLNVDPRHLSVEGVDLINLVNLGMVPPEGAYAIIDIGHEKSTVAICRGRHMGYIRAISIAGRAITATIAKRLGVPLDEAERIKIEIGGLPAAEDEIIDDLTKEVIAATRSALDEFLLHLRQTFFAYRETEDFTIEGIYLCGGSSRMPGIDRYLSDSLKLNVTYLNCSDFHFTQLDHADAHRHVVPQALSLALKGVAGGGSRINLRTGEFAFKGDVEQFGGNVRKIGFLIVAIIILALSSFAVKYYSVKRKIDRIQENVMVAIQQSLEVDRKELKNSKKALDLLKDKGDEVRDKIKQIKALKGISPLDIMLEVSKALPTRDVLKLEVAKIEISEDKVVMDCIVPDFKDVEAIKRAFIDSTRVPKLFSDVETKNEAKGRKGDVKFTLAMKVINPDGPKVDEGKAEDKGKGKGKGIKKKKKGADTETPDA